MKKRLLAMLLAAAFCITLGLAADADSPLLAPITGSGQREIEAPPAPPTVQTPAPAVPAPTSADPENAAPAPTAPANPAPAPAAVPAPAPVAATAPTGKAVTLGFTALDRTVRQNNLTIRANDETLSGIETVSYDSMELMYSMNRDQLKASLVSLQNSIGAMSQISNSADKDVSATDKEIANSMIAYLGSAVISTQASLATVEKQLETLDNTVGDINDNYAVAKKQMQGVADQLVVGAQSLYLSLTALELQQQDLQRSLAALDRTVAEMQKRYELGQVAQLQLLQVQNQRAQLASSIESLKIQVRGLKGDLALLAGYDPAASITLAALPSPAAGARNYDADLKSAIKNSYTLYTKNDAMRKASSDYERNTTSTVHAYNAAKIGYEGAEQQLVQSFRKLYDTVGDKERQCAVAKDNEAFAQRQLTAVSAKAQRGMASQNAFQTAKDEFSAAQSAAKKAEIELFTAVNQYEWGVRGVLA